jgi:hypothetical protein
VTAEEPATPLIREIKVSPFNSSPESIADAVSRFAPRAPVGLLSWPTVNFGGASRVSTAQTVDLTLNYLFATINETLSGTDSRRETIFDEFGLIVPALTDLIITGAGELPSGWASINLTMGTMVPFDSGEHSICVYSIVAQVRSKAIYSL